MFTALRVVAIIAVIFYLSPVRQGGGPSASFEDAVTWSRDRAPALAAPVEQAAQLKGLWDKLPEQSRRDMVDHVLTAGARTAGGAIHAKPATDTLQPEDLQPAWKGAQRR